MSDNAFFLKIKKQTNKQTPEKYHVNIRLPMVINIVIDVLNGPLVTFSVLGSSPISSKPSGSLHLLETF